MKHLWMICMIIGTLIAMLMGCSSETKKSIPEQDFKNVTSSVTITATNFKFDQTEYHVKKGAKVLIDFVAKEGNHGLLISDLDLNIVGSGKQVVTLETTGAYDIRCSIPCGSGHMEMVSKLIVD